MQTDIIEIIAVNVELKDINDKLREGARVHCGCLLGPWIENAMDARLNRRTDLLAWLIARGIAPGIGDNVWRGIDSVSRRSAFGLNRVPYQQGDN